MGKNLRHFSKDIRKANKYMKDAQIVSHRGIGKPQYSTTLHPLGWILPNKDNKVLMRMKKNWNPHTWLVEM